MLLQPYFTYFFFALDDRFCWTLLPHFTTVAQNVGYAMHYFIWNFINVRLAVVHTWSSTPYARILDCCTFSIWSGGLLKLWLPIKNQFHFKRLPKLKSLGYFKNFTDFEMLFVTADTVWHFYLFKSSRWNIHRLPTEKSTIHFALFFGYLMGFRLLIYAQVLLPNSWNEFGHCVPLISCFHLHHLWVFSNRKFLP